MGIKNDLYSVLNGFGKESLQIEFQNNINSNKRYFWTVCLA
jgi:hypothetical protein